MDELEELMRTGNEPPRPGMTSGDFLKALAILYLLLVFLCVVGGIVVIQVFA